MEGKDTIYDSDGQGKVVLVTQGSRRMMKMMSTASNSANEETILYGSTASSVKKGLWMDCKGNTYNWNGTDGSTLIINDSITVQNYKYGDLGIKLDEFPEAEAVKIDPLVIDLNRDGIELVDLQYSTAYFDLNSDGIKEKVEWVGSNDGFLVLDKNQNGNNILLKCA